ncbi:MAG: hypothetical protein EOO77_45785 [Oxalobacteraceae bacterium]|nr:MAG: hypothetical protein EOO77_45785 [Oxalobacteraceae bacterium]
MFFEADYLTGGVVLLASRLKYVMTHKRSLRALNPASHNETSVSSEAGGRSEADPRLTIIWSRKPSMEFGST